MFNKLNYEILFKKKNFKNILLIPINNVVHRLRLSLGSRLGSRGLSEP
jgi:hypothetical protein